MSTGMVLLVILISFASGASLAWYYTSQMWERKVRRAMRLAAAFERHPAVRGNVTIRRGAPE